MKKFLCYDTNDAASGKINVSANGVLKPNSTLPSTNGSAYQQLVTDGDGNVKWEDRLAYDDSRVVVDVDNGFRFVKVADEVPSWASVNMNIKIWGSDGASVISTPEYYRDFGNGNFAIGEAFFIMTDNAELISSSESVVFPEKGVYFVVRDDDVHITGIASADSDTPEITWDGNIGGIKKLDKKFLPDMLILYVHALETGEL